VTAVPRVDEHPDLVHPPHERDAPVGEARVARLGAAGTREVPRVVGQLDDADPEVVEEFEVREIALEMVGVLEVEDDPALALGFRAARVRRAQHLEDAVAERVELGGHLRELAYGAPEPEWRLAPSANRVADDVDVRLVPGRPVAWQLAPQTTLVRHVVHRPDHIDRLRLLLDERREALQHRRRVDARLERAVDAERVDDERLAVELCGACGVTVRPAGGRAHRAAAAPTCSRM